MTATLNLAEAEARFSEVVEKASGGEEIIITRMGRPVVKIIPYEPGAPSRRLGLFAGEIEIAEDFDEWPDDLAHEWGMTG